MRTPRKEETEEDRQYAAEKKHEADERRKYLETAEKQKQQALVEMISALQRVPPADPDEPDASAHDLRIDVLRAAAAYFGMLRTLKMIRPPDMPGPDNDE